MKLEQLLLGIDYKCIKGNIEQEIDQIIYDSRIQTMSGLFIAIEGYQTDGHEYIKSAIANGAQAVVVQKDVEIEEPITVIKVEDSRYAMAAIGANAYNKPSDKLSLVGVTGTNGKTSITFLLGQLLEAAHKKVGVIGTIENRIGNEVIEAKRTTPESLDLQTLFGQMVNKKVEVAMMEVSSHALYLKRVATCNFQVGIFTNLTQDHLDFHKTMDNYAKAKALLFKACKVGVINIDSDYAKMMMEEATCDLITYGIDRMDASYRASDLVMNLDGIAYTLTTPEGEYHVEVPIPGKFTVYNTLAVIATARCLGLSMTHILETLKGVKGVPGRVQCFNSKKGYTVLVDYAHTPDGLLNVLSSIKEFAKGRIITVFGCGGDRDKTKRPIMGQIAAKYSDHVIVTSDNPRTEDPYAILKDVEVGVKEVTKQYDIIEDRKQAIMQALREANTSDVVLIAGKGHENYQILNTGTIHFDDSEVVRFYLQEEIK